MKMRKTKIVCTLGPASSTKEMIVELVKAGMDVARLNFSHGDYNEHGQRIELVHEVVKETGKIIPIMMDTKGPEIRTGSMSEGQVKLERGREIILTTDEKSNSNNTSVSVSYNHLPEDVKKGSKILIDDGLIELKVLGINDHEIRCEILNEGFLGSHKGVNLPGISLKLPALTEKDKNDIRFGIENGVSFIAASFVRKARDVLEIRKLLIEEKAEDIYIISKIENQEGVDNIDEIIEVSDGIMIARGDLGVEIPPEKVPLIQKTIINKCKQAAKPVITATQMLDSMIRNPRPTRAEASDVANAIFDGTDAIMLSGESAIGDYPVETVNTMANIAREIEFSTHYSGKIKSYENTSSKTVTEAISLASCKTAMDLNARCIITATSSGFTARMVSKHRPMLPIIAVTHNEAVIRYLKLCWGVYPLKVPQSKTTDEMIDNAITTILGHGLVEKGDLVTITAGVPVSMSGTTNLIEVLVI